MSAETTARTAAKSALPRDQIDRDYNAANWPAGYKPDLARVKEFPEVMRIPPGALGMADRGRRVHGSPVQEEQAIESSQEVDDETMRAVKAAGEVLDRKLVRFLIRGKKGARIASRLAAIGIMSRHFKPKDIPKHFDVNEVTPARLRLATAELHELLDRDETGGAP
jgi:hypothetical protein